MSIDLGTVEGRIALKDDFSPAWAHVQTEIAKGERTLNNFSTNSAAAFTRAGNAAQGLTGRVQGLTSQVSMLGVASGAFAGVAATHMVGALSSMAAHAVSSANRIVDLADKTRFSTTAIQQMMRAANETGTSVENFTSAALRLQTRLNGGGESVRSAAHELGLEWLKLQQQSPEERFNAVVGALGRVRDETERTRMGQALFGTSFDHIAAAVGEGYDDMVRSAKIATDAQLRAIDALSERWDRFVDDTQTGAQRLGASLLLAFDESSRTSLGAMAGAMLFGGPSALVQGLAGAGEQRSQRAAEERASVKAAFARDRDAAAANVNYVAALQAARLELGKLDAAERKQIAAAREMGTDTEKVTDLMLRYGVGAQYTETVLRMLTAETRANTKEANAAARELEREQKRIGDQRDEWDGTASITRMNELMETYRNAIPTAVLYGAKQEEILEILTAGTRAMALQGKAIPEFVAQQLAGAQSIERVKDLLMAPLPGGGIASEGASAAVYQLQREVFEKNHGLMTDSLEKSLQIRAAMEGVSLRQSIAAIEREYAERRRLLLQDRDITSDTINALNDEERAAIAQTTRAYYFGQVETRQQLAVTAGHARIQFEAMALSGQFTSRQLQGAWRAWAEATANAAEGTFEKMRAAGRLMLDDVARDASYTFGQMLTFQRGFVDGALDMWNQLRSGVARILGDMVYDYLNGYIRKIAAMSIGKYLPGFGGGGLVNAGVNAGLNLLGAGSAVATTAFSAASSTTLAASMFTPAALAAPAIASQGVSATVAGGTAAGGGGLMAGAAAIAPFAALVVGGIWSLYTIHQDSINARLITEAWQRGDKTHRNRVGELVRTPDRIGRFSREEFLTISNHFNNQDVPTVTQGTGTSATQAARDQMTSRQQPQVIIHAPMIVEGMVDAGTARRFYKEHIIRNHNRAMLLDEDDVASTAVKATRDRWRR